METSPEIKRWRAHAKEAFKPIKNSCSYAFNDTTWDAFAAAAEAWQEDRAKKGINFDLDDLAKFFSELAKHVPGLVQEKPDRAAPTPVPWLDPVTGETPRNPFADPPDSESQAVLLKHDPHLAEHLRRIAKGGVTYKSLAEIREAEAARNRAASISYGAAEHARNPFLTGDITAQNRLAADPELAAFYEREAEPLQLPWGVGASKNLTMLGRLAGANPEAASIVQRAETLQHQWLNDQPARSRETEQTARAQREKAEALLRS